MTSPRRFRPDLANAVLEDRTLMAYASSVSQLTLTTNGYMGVTTPPGLSASLNMMGGMPGGPMPGGSSGTNMGTGFSISGFGLVTIQIGSAMSLGGGSASSTSSGSGGGSGGSGAASTNNARSTAAQGGTDSMLDALHIRSTSSSSDASNAAASGSQEQGSTSPSSQEPAPPVPAASPPS